MKIKKSIISVWQGALSLTVGLTLVLSSCTKEPLLPSMLSGDSMEVQVIFPRSVETRTTRGTEVGTDYENKLERVTILVFNQNGTKLETTLSVDMTSANPTLNTTQPKWESNNTLVISPAGNPIGAKKIYAIANWNKVNFTTGYTEANLKAELTTINAVAEINKGTSMLMSGSTTITNITSLSYNVTVNMARQLSKVRANVTISKEVQDKMSDIEWLIGGATITVVNIPNKSYIIDGNVSPAGLTLLNSMAITMNDILPVASDQTVPASKYLKWSESVYINENPITGASEANSTYIIVQLPYKNRTTKIVDQDNYYKLQIKTSDVASPYKVLRNTIYNFNISVIGMGLPINNLVTNVNINDQLTVNSWENGEVINTDNDNTPTNFTINRSKLNFSSTDTSLNSTIITDVPNWKLMKEDGTTMFSFADSKTVAVTVGPLTYTLSGTVSVATITVSKTAGATTPTTQKMLIIAKNLQVPFTVAY